jgi:hypothetical protein
LSPIQNILMLKLLQCSIPAFENILPPEHNKVVLDLLFELATFHALAKLRLHTERTLRDLEASTERLGTELRRFTNTVGEAYITRELRSETAARGRRKAALAAKRGAPAESTDRVEITRGKTKKFNMATYKLHALGDYAQYIRLFGTSDGWSSQNVRILYNLASFAYMELIGRA